MCALFVHVGLCVKGEQGEACTGSEEPNQDILHVFMVKCPRAALNDALDAFDFVKCVNRLPLVHQKKKEKKKCSSPACKFISLTAQ